MPYEKLANTNQKRLQEVFDFDPTVCQFYWKNPTSRRVSVGDLAGTISPSGYRRIKLDGTIYQAHRLVWLWVYGTFPENDIDHINGNTLDNRVANLREALPYENSQNIRKYRNNTSGYVGAFKHHTGRWFSKISVKTKAVHLGLFDSPEEAHQAYLNAKRKLHEFQPTLREDHDDAR